LLTVCLVAVGIWHIGDGSWIYAKARLAQYLLQRAWSRTLAGEIGVKPWPWADTYPVARLTVPSMEIDLIVLNGAYGRTLAFGPGYSESSAFPGSPGTTIVTGHRDTHFRFLRQLKRQDEIVIETVQRTSQRYLIQSGQIVDARSASIDLSKGKDQLILVTCYPFDALSTGGPLRYVVTAVRRTSPRLVQIGEEGDGAQAIHMQRTSKGSSSRGGMASQERTRHATAEAVVFRLLPRRWTEWF
jgi:sortase A